MRFGKERTHITKGKTHWGLPDSLRVLGQAPQAMKTVGLIVNPVAGMGGRVGLKGTDGAETLEKARSLGARPESSNRAIHAVNALVSSSERVRFLAAPKTMGENAVRACGAGPEVLAMNVGDETTAEDTIRAAEQMKELGVDLLLFAGGDGTARDIVAQVQDQVVCLGVPTGVKMHSAVFAVNPARAGELAAHYLFKEPRRTRASEVMDIDEEAFRKGHLSARLFGYMTIPFRRGHVQGQKAGSPEDERFVQQAIATGIVHRMKKDVAYVIGPGTTTAEIMKVLGLDFSLLGVDLVRNKELLGRDLSEDEILARLGKGRARIIVTPVGGQGYLFGRGNQPISARVIRKVGKEDLIIVATPTKLTSLRGEPLRVDSGDTETDQWLSGYYRVASGAIDISVYRVSPA
jgi:predicted polyphosphate/ATP-dependent NAD kinase